MNEITLTVPGDQIRVGDLMRFRMSKHDPICWLRVEALYPGKYMVGVKLEGKAFDHVSIRNKSNFRQVRRTI